MQLLLVLLVAKTCLGHKVVDSTEDLSPEHFFTSTISTISTNSTNSTSSNTTLLHPVSKRTDDRTSSASTWKISTTPAESQENATSSEHLDNSNNFTMEKQENASAKFKPSPQEGSLDTLDHFEDNFVVPTSDTYRPFNPFLRRPPTGLFSSYKEERRHPIHKVPPEFFKHYHGFPYHLETIKDDWKPYRPTKVPKPAAETHILSEAPDSPEFGLDFHGDIREMTFKKRAHPMQGLVRLLATLIPVGVIVSALTPGVITLHTTANNANNNPNGINNNSIRRADVAAGLPDISERCRRRLLCELQQDHHYQRSAGGGGCRRMRCEDPAALRAALGWLLRRPQYDSNST